MLTTRLADLTDPAHGKAVVDLLNVYALDEMGGAKELSTFVKKNLVPELSKRTDCHVVLAFSETTPVGLAICFEGFSTFSCRPLLNIHDIVVAPVYRGQGVSTALLAKVEERAREMGCCKLTLEVLEGNAVARASYAKFGFRGYELQPELGHALFWEKRV